MTAPRISIITATYNARSTLQACIDSVASQSIDVEHVLIDGLSTDGTMDVVRDNASHFSQIISEQDRGLYDAMNKGVRMVTGDVVGILNADDFYPTDDVLASVQSCFEDPGVEACYGNLNYVSEHDTLKTTRVWRAGEYTSRSFYWGWMPPHPTFFVRNDLYKKFGAFRMELGTAADYELMLRFMLRHRVTTQYIQKTLVHMRAGGVSNASLSNRFAANRMDLRAWRENDLSPLPWTLLAKPLRKVVQWL